MDHGQGRKRSSCRELVGCLSRGAGPAVCIRITHRASSNSTKANGGPRRFFRSTKVTLPNLWNRSWISLVRISGGRLPTYIRHSLRDPIFSSLNQTLRSISIFRELIFVTLTMTNGRRSMTVSSSWVNPLGAQ